MSYCRFISGDVYMYPDVHGGITCCACSLSDRVKSIFTDGYENHPLFGTVSGCEDCAGEGCDGCMMPDNVRKTVKQWAEEGNCRVAFFEARPKMAEFGLDIVRID